MKNPQIVRKETSQLFSQNAASGDFWDQPTSKGNRTLLNLNSYEYNFVKNNCYWRCRQFKQGCSKVRAMIQVCKSMKHAISNGLIHLGNFPFVNNFNSSMPHRFIQFIIFCREDIPNELLNNPFHNHPNKLLARSARNAEKQSHQDGCQQPQATVAAPRRVLGDLTSNISASITPDSLYM